MPYPIDGSGLVVAEPFEKSLQDVEVACVVDDEAPSFGVDSGVASERVCQGDFESPDIRVFAVDRGAGLRLNSPPPADAASLGRRLGLSHREAVSDDSLGKSALSACVPHRDERARMSSGELTGCDQVVDSRRQLQQP